MPIRANWTRRASPAVKHAFAVAEKMDDEDSTCAALLHDVVEDTDFTLDDLRAIGMSEAVVEAVDLLTRGPDQDYFAYVLARCAITRLLRRSSAPTSSTTPTFRASSV